jgi:hypothetical protein
MGSKQKSDKVPSRSSLHRIRKTSYGCDKFDWQCGSSSPMIPVKRHDREKRQILHSQEEYCLYSFIFMEAIISPLNSTVVRDDYTHTATAEVLREGEEDHAREVPGCAYAQRC